MTDFYALTHALMTTLQPFGALASAHSFWGERVLGAQRDDAGSFALLVNDTLFPAGVTSKRFTPSAHERLALDSTGRALAHAIGTLEEAIWAVPGNPHGTILGLLFQPNLHATNTRHGNLAVEAAALCASGVRHQDLLSLDVQARHLAERLTAAQTLAAGWAPEAITPWFVLDLPDDRGPGRRIGEVLAVDADSALEADLCWNWRTVPTSTTGIRRCAFPTLQEAVAVSASR